MRASPHFDFIEAGLHVIFNHKDLAVPSGDKKGEYMKQVILIFLLLFAFALPGCSGDKAAELYNTAGFEELQNNREHALKLYEEIIEKYPDGEYAQKAEDRIEEIKKSSKTR